MSNHPSDAATNMCERCGYPIMPANLPASYSGRVCLCFHKLGEPIERPAAQQQLDLLRRVEAAMSNSPEFNAWDLGPSQLLQDVRSALGMIPNPKKQR